MFLSNKPLSLKEALKPRPTSSATTPTQARSPDVSIPRVSSVVVNTGDKALIKAHSTKPNTRDRGLVWGCDMPSPSFCSARGSIL